MRSEIAPHIIQIKINNIKIYFEGEKSLKKSI